MGNARGSYGIDAPTVPIVFAICVLVFGVFVVLAWVTGVPAGPIVGWAIPMVLFATFLVIYLHSTRRGKFAVWDELLDQVDLAPDARVLARPRLRSRRGAARGGPAARAGGARRGD